MKLTQVIKTRHNMQYQKPIDCVITFLLLFTAILLISISIRYYNELLFHPALFFNGWFASTFGEYMIHRYLMHTKNKEAATIDFNHDHHHSHPTEIKISMVQRFLLLIGCSILIGISIWLHNYFTLLAGFLCGFPIYTCMHFLIHQKPAQKFLRKLVKYHIYHHCKYPDKCYGISVTWWDDIFRTTPSSAPVLSPRIIDFYFRKNDLQKNISETKQLIFKNLKTMKKIIISLAAITIIFCCTISCKKNDSVDVPQTTLQKILAKWQIQTYVENDHWAGADHIKNSTGGSNDYVDFKTDGKVYTSAFGYRDTTAYTVSGDTKIIMTPTTGTPSTYDIKTLNSSTLILYSKEIYGADFLEETITLKK